MSTQAWRIKFEQRLAVMGDDGMADVVDHLPILIRVVSRMRDTEFRTGLAQLMAEKSGQQDPNSEPILRRLHEDETITLAARDGSRFISAAAGTFPAGIDRDFGNWGLSKRGNQTPAMNVSVHEMIKHATFVQMFGSLNPDLDKLCFSQDQIIEFCEQHRSKLREDSYATFFLLKEGDQFYVAHVDVNTDGLRVYVFRLEHDLVWHADSTLRVVVPQLTV